VKRTLGIVLLAAVGAGVTYGFAVTQREAAYRRFVEGGDAALSRDDSYAAIEAFSVAISLKGDSMAAHLKRGEAYRRRREFDAALRDLRRAAAIDPLAVHPRELLGDVRYAMGETAGAGSQLMFARAVDRYRQSVALDDASARLQYKLGLAAYRAGQLPAAIAALQEAIRLDVRFAEAHYVLGLALRASQQPQNAVRSVQRAVALAPTLLIAREELADLFAALRRHDARLTQLEALAALQPSAARERSLGLGYARAGQLDRAIGQLARAAERYPADRETHVALGRLWLERAARGGRVELGKALEALQNGVDEDSGSEALTLLGRALLLSGDLAGAEQALQQAVVRFPLEPTSFLYLAETAERRGRPKVAHRSLLAYAELVPRASFSAQLLARLAEAHLRNGDHDAARRAVDAALEKEPANALAWEVRGKLEVKPQPPLLSREARPAR
jgi:tetratricopeptide (TPR) repeat protein